MMPSRVTIGALTPMLSTGVYADDRDDDGDSDGSRIRVAGGAGVSVEQSSCLGGDDGVEDLPRLLFQMGRFYLRAPAIGVSLFGV